nr:hypothetical protein [Brevibacillus laterosporus]
MNGMTVVKPALDINELPFLMIIKLSEIAREEHIFSGLCRFKYKKTNPYIFCSTKKGLLISRNGIIFSVEQKRWNSFMDNRFSSFQEFAQAFEQKWLKEAIEHGLDDQKMDIYLAKVRKKALFVWNKNQGDKWIEKQGYVIVDRKPNKDEIFRKKLGRGRPRKLEDERLQHAIHVRLDEETYQKLQSLCQKNNLDLSETIRMLIKKG